MQLHKLANSIGTSVMQIEKHYYHVDKDDIEKIVEVDQLEDITHRAGVGWS